MFAYFARKGKAKRETEPTDYSNDAFAAKEILKDLPDEVLKSFPPGVMKTLTEDEDF